VTDTGNVGSSFHSVGKSYSGDLTKCRVRLLGGNGGYLSANASSLRCALVDLLIAKCIEALLKHRRLRLVALFSTTLFYELVKGWHSISSFFKDIVFIYTVRADGIFENFSAEKRA
jgi:hypothetical protein